MTLIRVSVWCACMCIYAQVCRGSRAGRGRDRHTRCLWGQGLGGVLAGTTPDSNWVDAPWQFCTFMSLLIKVSTCWAGKTTVPVPPGPPYRTRRGRWEHFLPPVLPCPSHAHWADNSGQLWWPLVGQGWRWQPCQCQRWEQSCMALPDLGSENETWMPPFWLCNSQGQREVYRTFSVPVNVAGQLHVSFWERQNNKQQGPNLSLMGQRERANKHELWQNAEVVPGLNMKVGQA